VAAVETFANQPSTTVSSGGTTAPVAGTQESWTVASSASFPAASTGVTQFHVADTATGMTGEIIAVTNVSGTTWTVTRGAESTTPVAHTAGFTIVQVVTAGALGALLQAPNNLSDVASASTARTNLGLGTAAVISAPVSIANGGTGQATGSAALNALGGAAVAGDIGGTSASPQVTGTHLASPLPLAQGGTSGATQQAGLDALAGGVTSGQYLRGNGTHVLLASIVAGDLPAATSGAQGAVQLAGDLGNTASSPQVTGTHLASPLPLAQGGTGQATQQAAIDALAGSVTSGNYLRGNATHVVMSAIQAGDVPTLNQDTTGKAAKADALDSATTVVNVAAATAPSGGQVLTATDSTHATWQTLASIGSLTFTYGSSGAAPASGTFTTGTLAVDQNGVVRVCTSSGTPGTWARSGAEPWQFWVDDYGAKGDGKIVGDGAMTSSTATLTSATANFTSGDVGKNIVVNGALGSSSAPLYTTILSFTNSTTVVLNANATNTVSGAAVFWASDDSAAIVNAITAASTFAQAGQFKCQVMFGDKSYGLATLTTTTAGGSLADQNTLVPIPYPNVNGTTRKLSFELVGVGENADQQYFDSTIPCLSGTCLVATVAASGTNPSIIGGPYDSTNLTGTWANTKAVIKGISVWAGFNPGWIAFGLNQLASCWVDNACANVLAPQAAGQLPIATTIPANGSGVGMWMAANNDCGAGRVLVMGYYKGVNLSTRNTIEKLFTSAAVYGAFAQTVNGQVIHSARIGYWACQGVTNGLASTGTSGTMGLVVDMYDSTSTVTTDLNDPHGTLVGNMNWYHDVSTAPAVTAGFAMRITNLRQLPGPVASPSAPPSSTSAWQNTYWRDAEVTLSVSGGTLTVLSIDSVDQYIPASCVVWKFVLPSGHSYTPTYTGSLSHTVTLE
jgi:hypothetical protein